LTHSGCVITDDRSLNSGSYIVQHSAISGSTKLVNCDGNGNGNGGDSPIGSDQGDDEETIAKITLEAAELPVEPETKLGQDDEWGVDTSAAAVQARQRALDETMAKVSLGTPTGEDDEEDEDQFANGVDNPYDQLGTWVQDEHKETGEMPSDVEIYKKTKELGIESKSKTLTVLVQCVFTENICKEIPSRAALFATFPPTILL